MTLKKVFEVLSDKIIALCHFSSKFFAKIQQNKTLMVLTDMYS
jgi:hypothetical protein